MTGVYGNTIIAQNKKNTKMKPPKQSRAAKNIKEQNIIRKKEQEASRMFIQFRKLQAEISDLSDVKKAMETIQSRSSNMKGIPIIEMCLEWLKITVCLKELQQTKVSTNDTVILLLKTIQHILRSPELPVPTILKGDLKKIAGWLQFPALISMIKDSHIEFTLSVEQLNHFPRLCIPKHSFQFQDKKITSWVRFQLVYMGQNLSAERMNKPQKDDRVPFVPDEWQTKLLDIVDKNESALVCCPTSSGKTFCAYYAMQKVLESNDEDVVVYVAPTKALVNQVAAEIYARFKKNYPNGERTVWGIFTRDYRHEATRCQVLVTVPEMLGIIMLSPTNVSFSRRIKRVIFDEIHCIGQLDSGVVWEQLLMICQCPILCLSATIGNPEHLFSWLQKLQERHSINMHLIIHETRHVEIDKFYYNNEAEGTGFEFNQIHPWSCVDWTKSKNIMHVKLSSLETLQAFDALMELEAHENIDSPEVYFQNGLIDRLDVINYQNYIAGFVLTLGCDAFKDFAAKLRKCPSTGVDNIICVLRGLRKNDMLPAIVFTFDRASCEESAVSLLEHVQKLENLDTRYVQKKKKIEEEAQREAAAKTKLSSKALLELEKKGKTKPPENGTGFTARYFDYRKYSYISQKSRISNEEVDKIIDEALFRMPPNLLCLIECLRKGIGVHHVSVLFKSRCLIYAGRSSKKVSLRC
jgi:superfamily II RNA helicase